MSDDWVRVPKPVNQTDFGELGNCQSACIATLLGLSLSDVPNWTAMKGSDTLKFDAMNAWLRARGWGLVTICQGGMDTWPPRVGYFIAGGKSARGLDHAVIYRDGELWHDPHPDRTGIKSVETIDILYPLNPLAACLAAQEDAQDAFPYTDEHGRYRWVKMYDGGRVKPKINIDDDAAIAETGRGE